MAPDAAGMYPNEQSVQAFIRHKIGRISAMLSHAVPTVAPSPSTSASASGAAATELGARGGSPTGPALAVVQAVAPPSRPPPPPPPVPRVGSETGTGNSIGGAGGLLVSFSPATMALVSAAAGSEPAVSPPGASSLPPELEALLKTSVRDLTASMKPQASPPPKFQFYEGPVAPVGSALGAAGAASAGADSYVIP